MVVALTRLIILRSLFIGLYFFTLKMSLNSWDTLESPMPDEAEWEPLGRLEADKLQIGKGMADT
jgi:hypothetical protein